MHVEFQSAHSGTNDRALWKFRKHVRFLNRTVHKDFFGRLTEGHEGDVDEAQCLIDHLQIGVVRQYNFAGWLHDTAKDGIWYAHS